jgi:hypothetical protein
MPLITSQKFQILQYLYIARTIAHNSGDLEFPFKEQQINITAFSWAVKEEKVSSMKSCTHCLAVPWYTAITQGVSPPIATKTPP